MTTGISRNGKYFGRPRKSPLGMTAGRIQVAADRETRRALEELLLAWKVADISHNISRADVIRSLIVWAAEQVKSGEATFLPRKRKASC